MATRTPGIPEGSPFAYEAGIRLLDHHLRHADSLDTKAGIVLAIDGVLAGLVFGNDLDTGASVEWPVVVGAGLLLISFLLGLLAFGTRRLLNAPALEPLIARMVRKEDWLKLRVLGNIREAVGINREKLEQKARLLFWAQVSLFSAVVSLGTYLIYLQLTT